MKNFLLGTILFIVGNLHAQKLGLQWAIAFGGTWIEYSNSVTTDSEGNIYMVGSFGDEVDFNPGADDLLHTASDYGSFYLLKFASTRELLWARFYDGQDVYYNQANAVAVDNADNVYVTGVFGGTMDFDAGGAGYSVVADGDNDSFVLKLNSSGSFEWVKTFGGAGETVTIIDDGGDTFDRYGLLEL